MKDAIFIASVLAPLYLMLGLSILLYAKSWQKLYKKWMDNHYDLFPMMMILFVAGLLIIRTYNVWAWRPLVLVTITGWIMMIKGLLYFLLPGNVYKPLIKMTQKKYWLYIGGIFAIIWGLALAYYPYFMKWF